MRRFQQAARTARHESDRKGEQHSESNEFSEHSIALLWKKLLITCSFDSQRSRRLYRRILKMWQVCARPIVDAAMRSQVVERIFLVVCYALPLGNPTAEAREQC